jgi:hypothetical protein
MRWVVVVAAGLAVVACGKAPDGADMAGTTATSASGVAFAYRYDYRLPSDRIAAVQELHAQACEALRGRCRITGMSYRLDEAGEVSAGLDLSVAAPVARAFARNGTQAVERAGGALTGAEISGTDAAPAIAVAEKGGRDARGDLAVVDRQLGASDLAPERRRELQTRRDALVAATREAAAARAAAEESVTTTPVRFTYAAGQGVGVAARLSEAWQALQASLVWTLVAILHALAYLGPPAVALLLLALLWHRLGRRWWARAFPRDPGRGA